MVSTSAEICFQNKMTKNKKQTKNHKTQAAQDFIP